MLSFCWSRISAFKFSFFLLYFHFGILADSALRTMNSWKPRSVWSRTQWTQLFSDWFARRAKIRCWGCWSTRGATDGRQRAMRWLIRIVLAVLYYAKTHRVDEKCFCKVLTWKHINSDRTYIFSLSFAYKFCGDKCSSHRSTPFLVTERASKARHRQVSETQNAFPEWWDLCKFHRSFVSRAYIPKIIKTNKQECAPLPECFFVLWTYQLRTSRKRNALWKMPYHLVVLPWSDW